MGLDAAWLSSPRRGQEFRVVPGLLKAVAIAVGASILAAPGHSKPADWQGMSATERRATLDAIADQCRLPRATFMLDGEQLHVRPDPSASYESVECAVKKLKATKGAPLKTGFVENESDVDQ